jgi:hypothetical protein
MWYLKGARVILESDAKPSPGVSRRALQRSLC